jgi:hypothetical protein
MDTIRIAYRDDDRTPVIFCIKEIGSRYYDLNIEPLRIKPYAEFEASLFEGTADVLIDHVEFLYAEAAKGRKITFFCAPKIVRDLTLVVPKNVTGISMMRGKSIAVRATGRPYAVTLWLRMMGLEKEVNPVIVSDEEVGRWGQWKKVISGECIACFMDSLYLSHALEAGLKILPVPDLEAISHYAQACTSQFARAKPELLARYVKTVIHALCWMKYCREDVLTIVHGEPMRRMKVENKEEMSRHFGLIVEKLQIKPYPTLQAIGHTYDIAVDEYRAKGINPLTLWDLHWVKQLDDEGFIDGLVVKYSSGGKQQA